MGHAERRVLLILVLIGICYFALFAFPNQTGARDTSMISLFEPDEFAQYSYLTRMVAFEKGQLKQDIYNFVAYRHYYYGYPFYLASALTVLPVKLLAGLNNKNTEIPLFLLRQLVSVLPMLAAIGLMTYAQTRFRSLFASVLTFGLLLAIPAVVENNMWWHPDSLATLFVVLTIFFLDRDEVRFGRNFLFAALACGLATGTKLLGLLFFLAIPLYLLVGIRRGSLSWPRAAIKAVQFVGLMAAAIVVSNPFLLIPSEFNEMLRIQTGQASAMSVGWVLYYAKGPASWLPIITSLYGVPVFLACVGLLLLLALWQSGRVQVLNLMILAWILPLSLYILFAIAIKPTHFFLPIVVPLASCIAVPLIGLGASDAPQVSPASRRPWMRPALLAIVLGLAAYQILWSLGVDIPLYTAVLTRETTNSTLSHYQSLRAKYLDGIPDNEPLLIYRDVRMYFPQSRNRRVLTFFNTTTYQVVQQMNPDLIVLWRQRLLDYTSGTAAQNAISHDAFREVSRFFGDARGGNLAGYHLLYQDDAGLTFIRDDLFQKYFAH